METDSSSDEKQRYEAEFQHYEAEYKRRSQEDEARKQAAEARRKAEDRRSSEDPRYAPSSQRKMSVQEEAAIRYQHKSRTQVEAEMSRPSPTRTQSRDYYPEESRSYRKEARPDPVRRSSARPKDRPSTSGRERDRAFPEIVEWGDPRSPPAFKHSSSSPGNIEIPRAPQRSKTEYDTREHRRSERSPPAFQRSSTMPIQSLHTSSRRKEATTRPSGLRETMTPEHSSPERDGFPTVPLPQSTTTRKVYHYPEPVSASKPRTVLREPGRSARSPEPMSREPLSRPPIGPNRPSESSIKYTVPSASKGRHGSPVRAPEERGRTKLYGEVGLDSRGRPRQASYSPANVSYSRKIGPEDIHWAPQSSSGRGDFVKPSLGRSQTAYVYATG